jgi:uncharacterized protein YdeI (YjbR/CyaY-like superfamily)
MVFGVAPKTFHDATGRAFSSLSFTHRRENVEWVEEVKRPETRARRIAGTVERVAAGRASR